MTIVYIGHPDQLDPFNGHGVPQPITFRVYDRYGKLKPTIVAAYLQDFLLTKEVYAARIIRETRGDFILQDNPELDYHLATKASVQVICSFQIHDTFRIAVCKIKDVRHEG